MKKKFKVNEKDKVVCEIEEENVQEETPEGSDETPESNETNKGKLHFTVTGYTFMDSNSVSFNFLSPFSTGVNS